MLGCQRRKVGEGEWWSMGSCSKRKGRFKDGGRGRCWEFASITLHVNVRHEIGNILE